jgi:hypothetical protein
MHVSSWPHERFPRSSAVQKEHPTLHNVRFLQMSLAFLDLDPDSKSGSIDLVESGSKQWYEQPTLNDVH